MLQEARLARSMEPVAEDSGAELRDLVARAGAGDAEAFHAIFRRFAKPLLSYIDHLLGDRARAEECLQETFVRAYRKLASLRDAALVETWLFGVARNVVREAIKAKYRAPRSVALDEPATLRLRDSRSGPDEAVIGAELELQIRRALGALTIDQRAVFVLKLLHAMSYEEISQVTGSSVGKLKTDLHRARLELRRRLGPYVGVSGKGVNP